MGNVSPFSAFRLEDFPTEQEWIDTLFLPLNYTLGELTQALNGQTTFGDNIPSFTRVLSGSNLRLPLSFQLPQRFSPTDMVVSQAVRNGVPITMAGAWSLSGDTVTVSELFQISSAGNTALETGAKYLITLRFT